VPFIVGWEENLNAEKLKEDSVAWSMAFGSADDDESQRTQSLTTDGV